MIWIVHRECRGGGCAGCNYTGMIGTRVVVRAGRR